MGHICYMQHQGALRIATRLPISVGKVPVRPQAVTEKLAVEVLGPQNQTKCHYRSCELTQCRYGSNLSRNRTAYWVAIDP